MGRKEWEYLRPLNGGNAEETALYAHICRECGLTLPYRAHGEQTVLGIFADHLGAAHGAVL
jgi:hypothetical protein